MPENGKFALKKRYPSGFAEGVNGKAFAGLVAYCQNKIIRVYVYGLQKKLLLTEEIQKLKETRSMKKWRRKA